MGRTKHLIAAAAAGAAMMGAGHAEAATWRLEVTGFLQASDGLNPSGAAAAPLGALTAFTFTALFDDDGLVYRAGPPGDPLPGYAAYAFDEATLTVNGVSYDVTSFADDPVHGVAVALFDPGNVFNPGFYAAGFFGNPLGVGAGVIARFAAADGAFSAADPVAATLTDYLGYGAVSGPTTDGGPGNRCQEGQPALCTVVPILLHGPDGRLFDLTLVSGAYDATGAYAFTANLTAVPLPSTLALMGTGLGLLGFARRRGGVR